MSNWIAEVLRARGRRLLVYLDDYILVHQDSSKLQNQVSETVNILRSLGWHINLEKSVLVPTIELEYIGLVWNTRNSVMALPQKKVLKVKAKLSYILERGCCTLRETQSRLLNIAN